MKKRILFAGLSVLLCLFAFTGCGQSDTIRAYDDFRVSFPQTWTVNTDNTVTDTDEDTPFLYVTAPSSNSNSSYFYIMYTSRDFIDSLDSINQDFGDSWAAAISDSIDITMTCDDIALHTYGSRKGALVTFTGSSNGLKLTYIEQLVPTNDKWYVFTYLIIDKQNKSEINNVIQSVTFN